MNIDEIEKYLNEHESNPHRVLAIILNTVVKNQALLETLIETNANTLGLLMRGEDFDEMAKEIAETTRVKLLRIQAEISAQL